MTANLHVSDECKTLLDSIIPLEINANKITYDDAIQAMVYYMQKVLSFTARDIAEMILIYKQNNIEKTITEITSEPYGN